MNTNGTSSKILIIEDEEKISRFVELELRHEGYETGKAADGRSGLEEALAGDYDLVILDIMLPELSGIEVLRRLRRESAVPVILLTARDSVTDKVTGLDMGANDYITKPFAIEELLARIRVILRNAESAQAAHGGAEPSSDAILSSPSGIEMNTDSHAVSYKGKAVELTNREFILLKILMENRGVAMTRERLLSEAWGYDYYGETNIIDVYVRYIRQKTADDVIRTIRGVGYMIE
ncbi:MAG: response regulator transcription factor [Ruminococcaceae bacterium]|jgi:DNA-binding response OmpR family regulator|nr:response regulator transcription factor [Oscillospiraceae bacterium]